ncbi:MAG TPA: N-acetylmuramoyl-L-alanine amidase [Methylomusa anaerophila]|uniref:N-acetylmuramoyl-L-alanine amidase AmiC n=1 Tax=Methylomusa anaerophila TaxID=1930071 RepID=A0A348AIE3_9FIRM|nr:N-acetylmuramoyl-L-alanine amidase [Methylomusa anaerophila]BBB90841.1 N-acetylmuramoyl-L-alanine amidase AmiC precursor [Methylomusa anaerophila]HML90635.1 N-acetylmuramoyl-L-alanine amidase [Methylomusa anaerophila]
MSNSRYISVLLFLILFTLQIVWASPIEAASQANPVELAGIRFAVHTDAITGDNKLRLVVDVAGPVQATASLDSGPASRLTVDIKGASAGKIAGTLALDGNIAGDVNISSVDPSTSRLIINLPLRIEESDYKIFTLPNDPTANKPFRVVVDIIKPPPLPAFHYTPGLSGKIIAIDPGHGGTDPGAIGPGGSQEKTVTLAVALKVKELLEKAGATVYMTRMDDRDVYAPNDGATEELNARVVVGNQNNADIFLDIHANAFQNPNVGGTATYYYRKSLYDKLLAQNLQNSVVNVDGLNNRGVNQANFYVLKYTRMPAALVELAFISNPDEEKLLNSPEFQQKIAQGLVDALDSFFTQAAKIGGGASASSN